MGLVAEVLMRTYYEAQGKAPYVVRDVLSFHQLVAEESNIPVLHTANGSAISTTDRHPW